MGNTNSKEIFCFVDNTGPEIFNHMSLQKIGQQKLIEKNIEIPIYASGTNLYLAATDKYVGTKTIYYSLNGSLYKTYGSAIPLNRSGLYKLNIKATDKLGNISKSDVIEFVVQ